MEMSRKEQQIPAIRFNGFTDAWEQRKLGEIAQFNPKSQLPDEFEYVDLESVVGTNLVLHRTENKETAPSRAQRLAKIGDVFYQTVRPYQKNNYLYDLPYDNYVFSTGYAQLRPYGNSYFLLSRVQDDRFVNNVLDRSTGTSYPAINSTDLAQIELTIPKENEEEHKIGSFFKSLDNTITLHQRQLDNYKTLKKVMLQKIFNQELRFKDQEGNNYPDWEKIALNELGETYTGLSGKTKENFGKGKGRFVTYMNVYSNPIADLAMTENVEIKDGENQNEVCYGDIFFTTSSETPEEVGMSSVWLSHESNVYLNSFCFGYRLNTESEGKVTHQFLGIQLRAEHIRKKIVLLAQGSTRFNISKAKLIEIPVYLPTIQEQQKITDFLLIVEARIDQTTQKIEWMKEQKKGLMQRMFI